MPEQEAPGGQEQQQQSGDQTPGGQPEPKVYDAEYVAQLRQENAKYRNERNDYKSKYDEARQKSMTPDEKALTEAEERGRSAARKESGRELARAAFDAAAGRRNPNLQDNELSEILEVVNLDKFVGDDGKVDQAAVRKAAERLVPTAEGRVPDLEGGHEGNGPSSTDMSTRIRKMAGLSR